MPHVGSSVHHVTKSVSFDAVEIPFLLYLLDLSLQLSRLLLELLDVTIGLLLFLLSALTKSR
jgi:hypothetical protein